MMIISQIDTPHPIMIGESMIEVEADQTIIVDIAVDIIEEVRITIITEAAEEVAQMIPTQIGGDDIIIIGTDHQGMVTVGHLQVFQSILGDALSVAAVKIVGEEEDLTHQGALIIEEPLDMTTSIKEGIEAGREEGNRQYH
jgi:hypothetical protein